MLVTVHWSSFNPTEDHKKCSNCRPSARTHVVLSQQMLPAIKHITGDAFLFQQDSAPAHRARDTIQLLQQETPDFMVQTSGRPTAPT